MRTLRMNPQYDDLRPNGEIVLTIDKLYNVPLFEINIDDWYAISVSL